MPRVPADFSEKTLFLTILLIALLSLFPLLHLSPLFDEDEGYYAEISREMQLSGDYITPRFNGDPEFDKPILTYWIQSIAITLFGPSEFAVRFPSALATWLWILLTFSFVRRHLCTRQAFFTALFLTSAIQVTITGKAAITDPLFNLFLALCMFSMFDFYKTGRVFRLYLTFLFAGLGVLTKGFIAMLIPVVVGAIFFTIRSRGKTCFKSMFNPLGITIFLAVSLPWFAAIYMEHGTEFIKDFLMKHHVHRFQTAMEGHAGRFFYYIPVIVIGTLPHSGLLFLLFRRLKRLLAEPILLFCLIWFLFVLLFFSMAGTKLPHYIIHGYPALLILYADAFEHIEKKWIYLIPGAVFLWVSAWIPLMVPTIVNYVTDPFAVLVIQSAPQYFSWGYYLISAGCGMGMIAFFFIRSINKHLLAVWVSIIFLVFVNLVVMPRVGALLQSPVKQAALITRESGQDVVMWGQYFPSFIFYRQDDVQIRKPRAGDTVITKKNRLERLTRYEILYEKNGVVLARVVEP